MIVTVGLLTAQCDEKRVGLVHTGIDGDRTHGVRQRADDSRRVEANEK